VWVRKSRAVDQIYTTVVRDGKPEIVAEEKNCRTMTTSWRSLTKQKALIPGRRLVSCLIKS
jgi:hypothetical protein